MKQILKNWKEFLTEEKEIISSKEELIKIIRENPNQKIFLDNPKGTTKKFGGVNPVELPFDYGEYPDLVNPADNMGWDIILVPSADKGDTNLLPVGHVSYSGDEGEWNENAKKIMPDDLMNNHKIIVAPAAEYNEADKKLIDDFFSALWQFKEVEWYE